MPELPEVETVRRGLEPVLEGARLVRVEARRPDLRFPLPENFAGRLTGRRVESLGRRAKYLTADLDDGTVLVMHLGMSGSFRIEAGGADGAPVGAFRYPRSRDASHDHVVFHTGAGARVVYNDPRRFGFMDLVPRRDLETHATFAGLGPEPLGNAFDAGHLARMAHGRRTPLKAFLLEQRVVAGLGNIYVCEALSRAGLSPKRRAGTLSTKAGAPAAGCERLAGAVRAVLAEAIDAGGSSIGDHARPNGELGYFQHSFRVYDREGAPCPTAGCRGTIRRIVQSGRSSFYCPACQR